MSKEEIAELLELTGWSKAMLAARLELSENAVIKWLGGQKPMGPARILMRQWLEEARRTAKKQPA